MATASKVVLRAAPGSRVNAGFWPPGSISVSGPYLLDGEIQVSGSLLGTTPLLVTGNVVLDSLLMSGGFTASPSPTVAVLSGSSTATVGVAQNYQVTLNSPAEQTYTVSWLKDGVLVATNTITTGNTQAAYSSSWSTVGGGTIDFTISPSISRTGRPINVTVTGSGSFAVGALQHDGPATPEQISLWLPVTGNVPQTVTATCRYRVSPSGAWSTGHPLYRIRPTFSTTPGNGGAIEDGFAWPIIDVQPGTAYDVEVTLSDGASTQVLTLTHTTRALPAAAGAVTVNVAAGSTAAQIASAINSAPAGAVIQLANGTYNLSGSIGITSGGTTGSPKYVRGASRAGVVLARSTVGTFFEFQAATGNLIIEDMTFQGNGVDQPSGSAAYTTVLGSNSLTNLTPNITIRRTTATGIDRGIYVYNAQGLLAYDNTWTGNNLWQLSPVDFLNSSRAWDDDGMLLAGIGNCAFNNTLKGFGDTLSCVYDDGSHGRGLHFYRNDIRNSCDDVIEFDDARRNLTFYDNRIHNSIDFESFDPLYGGPALLARNIYINGAARSYPHKWNTTSSGFFLYNNTYLTTASAIAFDPDVSAWYQSGGRNYRSYGYRNNILVYRGGGLTLWMDGLVNDPIDWTHNSWFPNRDIQFQGSYYPSGLSQIQSAISNRTPVFSGTNRPFQNDNITTTNPWTTTITLGANANTEVTTTHTPVLAAGSAPKNSGVAIPNITDGFSGAAPDRGAVIEGRSLPLYGDRSSIPAYIASMTNFEVRAMSGSYAPANGTSTMAAITTGAWETDVVGVNYPDAAGVINAWCGAFKAVQGSTKLLVHGGGHFDSANNGIYQFEYAGSDRPTGWSIVGQSASPANAVQGGGAYTDGKPTSIHSYDGLVYASHDNCCYRFGGAYFGLSSGKSNHAWKFNLGTGQWTQLANVPVGIFGTCVYDPVTRKILVMDGSDFSSSENAYFFRCEAGTWSSAKPMGLAPGNDAVSAWDPTRGRVLVSGSLGERFLTVNFVTETVSASAASAAGISVGRAFFYDQARDVYWAFGSSGSGPWTTITEINAATLATIATHNLSQSIPSMTDHQGAYGRFVFVPEWRAIGTIASNTTPAYVIKLPNA